MRTQTYGQKRSSPLHKNKQKQWRGDAANAKREFLKLGKHELGFRYGAAVRQAWGAVKIKALPSQLFLHMCAHTALIDLKAKLAS